MLIKAVIENKQHPEYGVMSAPFPIPHEEYDKIMDMLRQLEIGDVLKPDCYISEINDAVPILKRLEETEVNIDELDYLAKRLDSFAPIELAQFQAMAAKDGYAKLSDLINLTFCCQQATVITDFSDLSAIGRQHQMNINGGCIATSDLEKLDFRHIALDLLLNHTEGSITPYGVVYPNNMELKQEYRGKAFPEYQYGDCLFEVKLETYGNDPAFLFFPAPESCTRRTMERIGISALDEADISISGNGVGMDIVFTLGEESAAEDINTLNDASKAVMNLTLTDHAKLCAVMEFAQPESAAEVKTLAENLEMFEFVPDICTAEQYGRYCIQESGKYDYDENLDRFYDYETYGKDRIEFEDGKFNSHGYIAYCGEQTLDELLSNGEQRMGGMT